MKELLINQIAPILVTAIVAILVATINKIGGPAIDLFVTKKKETELKIIASGHEANLNTAKEVWNIVNEKFRITANATLIFTSKADLFDKLLLSKIPGLTQDNLDHLRQAIAGEVNKGKATLTEDSTSLQLISLQKTNGQLEADKATLQATINQINSTLNPVVANNSTTIQA